MTQVKARILTKLQDRLIDKYGQDTFHTERIINQTAVETELEFIKEFNITSLVRYFK